MRILVNSRMHDIKINGIRNDGIVPFACL